MLLVKVVSTGDDEWVYLNAITDEELSIADIELMAEDEVKFMTPYNWKDTTKKEKWEKSNKGRKKIKLKEKKHKPKREKSNKGRKKIKLKEKKHKPKREK